MQIPIFPLGSVLFPGGVLPLRIFEPRYIDMVSKCMRESSEFGVVLIRQGAEARLSRDTEQPEIFTVGTMARIVDFSQADHGLLGVVAQGTQKFSVRDTSEQADHLMLAEVDVLPEEPAGELLPEHQPLIDVLMELAEHPLVKKLKIDVDVTEARAVSYRLAELLPVEPEIKQALLQMQWPKERLTELGRIVKKFQG